MFLVMKKLVKFDESSKFFVIKNLIGNLKDMLVELNDENISYKIEPSNEIRMKFVSLGKDGYFHINLDNLETKKESYNILSENIKMIVDYMDGNGFDTEIQAKYKPKNKPYIIEKIDINTLMAELDSKNMVYHIELNFIMQDKPVLECLPNERTIKQLKRVAKLSKKTDIGNRISDMNKQGANIHYIQNPIETGIESREDYEKNNRKKMKHLKKFNESFESKSDEQLETELTDICEYRLLDILDKDFVYYINFDDADEGTVLINIYCEDGEWGNAVFNFIDIKEEFFDFIEYLNDNYNILGIRFNKKVYDYDSLFKDDFHEDVIEHLDIIIKK